MKILIFIVAVTLFFVFEKDIIVNRKLSENVKRLQLIKDVIVLMLFKNINKMTTFVIFNLTVDIIAFIMSATLLFIFAYDLYKCILDGIEGNNYKKRKRKEVVL